MLILALRLVLKQKVGKKYCLPLLVLRLGLRYFLKRGNIRKGFVEIEDWGTSVHFVLGFWENYMQSLFALSLLMSRCLTKRILKALFSFIPRLLNFSDLPSYGLNSRKRYTLKLFSMCLGRNTPPLLRVKSLLRFLLRFS